MISRRDMLKTSGAALAGLAAIPATWPHPARAANGQDSAAGEDLTRYVDPFIGTSAHGHTYPGANLPFGMVQLSPDNGVNGWDWCSGYHWSSDRIVGFSHTHLSGTGIGDMYDILFMPALTTRAPLGDVGSSFSHERESAAPGYYSVELDDPAITAELTATERCGVHRYAFSRIPSGQSASIVVDLGHSLNWDRPTEGYISVEGPTLVSGYRMSTGWARDQRVFFAAQFSRPISNHWLEAEWTTPARHQDLKGERVKGCFQLSTRPGQRVVAKIALSPVSIESAKRNLREEVPGWDFDGIRAAAIEAWNRELNRIQLGDTDPEGRTLLYTSLYHAFLAPQLFGDVDGNYRGPDTQVHRARGFDNYTVFSLWDTYRAEHPLLTLVQPERVNDLIQSMMAFYREEGLLPVWSLAGNETNTMIGYHSVPVILDAWAKDLTEIDPREALEAMVKSAEQDDHGLRYYRVPEPRSMRAIEEEETSSNLRRVSEVRQGDLINLGLILNGYSYSLGGDTLRYHSPFPTALRALLIRSDDGTKSIDWETAPVPEEAAGTRTTFAWLTAMDAGESRRWFELSVNGERWFEFRGPRERDRSFTVNGPGGSRLVFRVTHVDQHGDLFGFMFLTVPTGLEAGESLRLSVTAETAGSSDWYMTFEQPLEANVMAGNVFAFTEIRGERRQVVKVDITHLGRPTDAEVQLGAENPIRTRLAFGSNSILLSAPQVRSDTPMTARLTIGGQLVGETEFTLRPVRAYGYVPADWENESVSKTLEYAYDDWCIARMADRLGEDYAAGVFGQRAQFYRNVFDSSTGFMRGRRSDGTWVEPFSPTAASHRQAEYTEGNAWQYSWYVPHDVRGLIELMGGDQAFIDKLDELFERSSEMEGAPPDVTGLIGQYAHGNEPSHHIAYLYCHAGAPWKTQERVRQITDAMYDTTPEGLSGNEDCGQMSAWYIFSSIGFYPVNPADGTYVIGTPHHEDVSIELSGGRRFTVEAPGASSVNKYIQSANLNGAPLQRCYITHEEIVAGGTLAFVMGDTPNEDWAATESARPPEAPFG